MEEKIINNEYLIDTNEKRVISAEEQVIICKPKRDENPLVTKIHWYFMYFSVAKIEKSIIMQGKLKQGVTLTCAAITNLWI